MNWRNLVVKYFHPDESEHPTSEDIENAASEAAEKSE